MQEQEQGQEKQEQQEKQNQPLIHNVLRPQITETNKSCGRTRARNRILQHINANV